MDECGKKYDILIEDYIYEDEKTGIKIIQQYFFTVWADSGKKEIIKKINGVTNVYTPLCENRYEVYIDHRFDKSFVQEEIRAAILCDE
jgi:hypothetical protein